MTRATSRRTRWKRAGGFMLLEALLAVTIFAIGVLTLGRCVSGCLSAESSCKLVRNFIHRHRLKLRGCKSNA